MEILKKGEHDLGAAFDGDGVRILLVLRYVGFAEIHDKAPIVLYLMHVFLF